MHDALVLQQVPLSALGRIRDLLSLFQAIRGLTEPLTTPQGLRQVVALLVRMAELVGLDPAWTARLSSILQDERVFNLVLAIVQFLTGTAGRETTDNLVRVRVAAGEPEVVVDELSLAAWLPLVLQLLALLRQIRGER